MLGESEGATLFMTLLSVLNIVLYKNSGQRDLVIGSPIANRNYHEIEGLIGFFVNMLALRTEIDPRENFRKLLRRVKEKTLGAYEHQDVPFEQLVDHLNVQRNLNRNPLFQVMFVLQNIDKSDLELGELSIEWIGSEYHTAKFDLSVFGYELEGKLHIGINYLKDIFTEETVKRMVSKISK